MSSDEVTQLAPKPTFPEPAREPVARDYQELWLSLARNGWRSLVLVPVDAGASVMDMAKELAHVGSQLSDAPVTAILADGLDYPGSGNTGTGRARTKAIVNRVRSLRQGVGTGQLIVGLQPVTVEPLGVVIARTADAVVLCVRMGESRTAAVRRTIGLIGQERIAGCLVID